jgi:hypothetical protein
MGTAEDQLLSFDGLPVAPLVDLATAVGADVEARLDCHGYEVGEALEEPVAQGGPLLREVVDLPLLLPHHLDVLTCEPLLLEALEEGIDEAWADLLPHSVLEFAEYAVAVGGALVEDGEDVEPRKVGDEIVDVWSKYVTI